ncbi:EamA family transporter [Sinorhizobium meliloti]|uniref:DMT family transporter n=1 Tax=Rhizobium meliloti TaxID=382 RepID=UPI0013ABE9B9|nr:EamA family transporter [Sinorhizobium meliloti]
MTRIQANLFLLFSGAIWGAGFVAQSTAMDAIGPLWFIGLRFAIATLVVTVVFLRRRPHWVIWPAALLAAFGIFLLSGGALSALTGGDMLTIVCALFWAVQLMLVGLFAPATGRPMLLSMTQFAVCAVAGCVLAGLFEPLSLDAINGALPQILYAGIFSSGIAFICQVVGQRYTTAPQAAIFLSSEALFAALFGVLLLGETITPVGYVGCAVIFLAMLAVELVPELTKKRREAAQAAV